MPVASGRSGGSRQLAVLAFATVAALGSMLFLVSRAPSVVGTDRIDINLGEEVFVAGNNETTADFIAEQGPWLMSDLIAGRDRDLILQHLGDDPDTGWFAFAARPADSSRDCFLEWQIDDEHFVDRCTEEIYDAEGSGLTSYPVLIDADGNVLVDINASDRSEQEEEG